MTLLTRKNVRTIKGRSLEMLKKMLLDETIKDTRYIYASTYFYSSFSLKQRVYTNSCYYFIYKFEIEQKASRYTKSNIQKFSFKVKNKKELRKELQNQLKLI